MKKRHICSRCKSKLYEENMIETKHSTNFGHKIWLCHSCNKKVDRIYAGHGVYIVDISPGS